MKIILFVAIVLISISYANAFTVVNIINTTIKVNTTDIVINISNNLYFLNNSNSTISLQTSFNVSFDVNATNATITSTCNNATISFSCNCPSAERCPDVNCSVSSEVSLNNETKELFFNHYQTSLQTKIEESANKVAEDVKFALEPTRAELEGCKQQAFNASLKQVDAERKRDEYAGNYLALSSVVEGERRQNKWLLTASGFMVIVFLVFIFSPRLGDVMDDIRHMKGGGSM